MLNKVSTLLSSVRWTSPSNDTTDYDWWGTQTRSLRDDKWGKGGGFGKTQMFDIERTVVWLMDIVKQRKLENVQE
jgi:hypothetical protein